MATILGVLKNAKHNLCDTEIKNPVSYFFGKEQLKNAIILLEKNYPLCTDVEEILKKHSNIDNIHDYKKREGDERKSQIHKTSLKVVKKYHDTSEKETWEFSTILTDYIKRDETPEWIGYVFGRLANGETVSTRWCELIPLIENIQ